MGHARIKRDLEEQCGLQKDLTMRPKEPYTTEKGNKRGPDVVQVARALYRVSASITPTMVLILLGRHSCNGPLT